MEYLDLDQATIQNSTTDSLLIGNGDVNELGSATTISSTPPIIPRKPPTQIDQLPAELKCQVTEYLSSMAEYLSSMADLKSLSLVDRTWASVAMPLIWEIFYADQALSPCRQIRALTDTNSNIVKFVKHTISARHLEGISSHTVNCLPLLLALVPHGQIRRYSSCGDDDSFYCFTALLQTQQIQELSITARSWNKLASLRDVASLSHVKRLRIDLRRAKKYRTYFDLQKLLSRCGQLEDLDFVGIMPGDGWGSSIDFTQEWFRVNEEAYRQCGIARKRVDNHFDDVEQLHEEVYLEGKKVLKVRNLRFRNLIMIATEPLLQRLDVHELCVLTLVNVPISSPPWIFDDLTTAFNGKETRLHTFTLTGSYCRVSEPESRQFTKSLQLFLVSFQGLKRLHVGYETSFHLDIGCVAHHGGILQELPLVNGATIRKDHNLSVSVTDLVQLAQACPHLEFICLNLYELDVDDATSHLPSAHTTSHTPTEFAEALLALCTMEKVRVLRFTNPSTYRNSLVYERTCAYKPEFKAALANGKICQEFQTRADEMMKYLKHHGSNIQLLAFAPYEPLSDLPEMEQPISWPNYAYTPVHSVDEGGREVVRAQILTNWEADLRGTFIFDDIGRHRATTLFTQILEIEDKCSYFVGERRE